MRNRNKREREAKRTERGREEREKTEKEETKEKSVKLSEWNKLKCQISWRVQQLCVRQQTEKDNNRNYEWDKRVNRQKDN